MCRVKQTCTAHTYIQRSNCGNLFLHSFWTDPLYAEGKISEILEGWLVFSQLCLSVCLWVCLHEGYKSTPFDLGIYILSWGRKECIFYCCTKFSFSLCLMTFFFFFFSCKTIVYFFPRYYRWQFFKCDIWVERTTYLVSRKEEVCRNLLPYPYELSYILEIFRACSSSNGTTCV